MNKLLLVEKVNKKKAKTASAFVLPEDSLQPRYSVVKLVRFSGGTELDVQEGDLLVVQTALIDEIVFEEQKFHVVSENGVVARLQEDEL